MWPFRRKAESSPAGSGPQPVPGPVIRREWVGLPPIQRIIGEHPLTAPSERFSDDLATHHDPSISADTMGHQVSAEAPAGIILTLARPSTRSDGPAMIPRPRVQRRVDGAVVESGEWDGDEAASDGARPSPRRSSPSGPTTRARATAGNVDRDRPDARPGDGRAGARAGPPNDATIAGQSPRRTAFGPATRAPSRGERSIGSAGILSR